MVLFIIILKKFWNESGSILFKNLNMNSKLCQRLLGFVICKIMDLWKKDMVNQSIRQGPSFDFGSGATAPSTTLNYKMLYMVISINNKASKRVTCDTIVLFIFLFYTIPALKENDFVIWRIFLFQFNFSSMKTPPNFVCLFISRGTLFIKKCCDSI